MDLITEYALWVIALGLALATSYLLGEWRGSQYYHLPSTRTEDGAVLLTDREPVQAQLAESMAAQVEIVELPAVTAQFAALAPSSFTALPLLAMEPDPVAANAAQAMADEREALIAENARLAAELHSANTLRIRYLRRARAQTERLNFMLGDVMNAPRRPTKAALAAVVLELPRGRQLSLVPPSIAQEWSDAS